MQVLTLNPNDFDLHAEKLAQMAAEDPAAKYDAIVAVRRGGSYVCDSFCRYFPKDKYAARYDVTLQRPSTRHKNGVISRMLKKLPLPWLDIMRMAESYLLTLRRSSKGAASAPGVEIPEGLADILHNSESPAILIIDDAIDSGDTLCAIVKSLKDTNPKAIVRIAVMTETTRNPQIHADYTLYRNRTLIRFPWSNDYKHS